tara:strand:- start:49416 stop:49631 length:216 start_codon:yes stop_codon:yes gene_type:complete
MATAKPYNVSFKFRHLPPHRLEKVMGMNADHAAKLARLDMKKHYGYSDDDLNKCLVSTSRHREKPADRKAA